MSSLRLRSITGLVWLAATVSCTGGAGPGQSGKPEVGSGGSGASPVSGAGTGGQACVTPAAAPLYARLLTPGQYENVVEDLVKVTGHPAKSFGGGVAARLDEVAVEQRANAAAAIASQAVASLSAWAPCMPPNTDATTCGAQLVERLGAAAFRHSLSSEERAQLQKLFDAGMAEKDFATGVDWLLTGLLQSPDFLYQLARPKIGESAGQVVPLDGYEMASRLSFFVWNSAPDAALYDSAATGALQSPTQLAAEAERMIGDARFERGVSSFYSDWLGLEGFREVARDDPGLTSEVIDSLLRSVLRSATSLYASPAPTFQSLFVGESYFMDDRLRAFYGVGEGSPELSPAALVGQGRRGLITHPALMTLLARPGHSDPIARGLFVQRALLCNSIPLPPPSLVIPELPPLDEGLSTRARLERHTESPVCAACHDMIDPPGFALEAYDEVGRFRTMDHGVPVTTSGTMPAGTDVAGPFASGVELFDRLAESGDVKRCFSERYLSFALARALQEADECSLRAVSEEFVQTGNLKQLVSAVVKSDAFRLRATEAPGAAP